MQLIKDEKKYWETVIKGVERVNAEGDIIVPDVKPDVLKVLELNARSVITDKGITHGGIYVQGKVYVNILYAADGDSDEMGCLKASFDFRTKIDNPQITSDMKLKINSDVAKIDFILLNSRKLSIKASVALNYEVTAEKTAEFPCDFDDDKVENIKKTITIDAISTEEEYDTIIRDTLEIPSGKPSVKEIIKTDISVKEREIRVMPSKVVIRGTLGVCALYFTNDMTIDYCEGEVPFTEVFDADEISENDFCDVDIIMGNINTELAEDNDSDIRLINLECTLTVFIRARKNEEINYICDCYCSGKKTKLEHSDKSIYTYVDYIQKNTNEREVIKVGENIPTIGRIYNVVAEPEITKCNVAKGGVGIGGKIRVYVLYLTGNNQCAVYSIKKDLDFEYFYQCEGAEENMECDAKIRIENLSYALNSKGEIELKYTLWQGIRIYEKINLDLICDAQFEDKEENDDIVIYFVKKGDTLWGIGRMYGIKVSDIMEINNIENDSLSEGQKLLIPLS